MLQLPRDCNSIAARLPYDSIRCTQVAHRSNQISVAVVTAARATPSSRLPGHATFWHRLYRTSDANFGGSFFCETPITREQRTRNSSKRRAFCRTAIASCYFAVKMQLHAIPTRCSGMRKYLMETTVAECGVFVGLIVRRLE